MAISVTGLTCIFHEHPSRALRKPQEGAEDPPAATAAPPGSKSQGEACGGRRTCGTQTAAHFAFWRRRKASFKLRGRRRAEPRPRAARRAARSAAAPTVGRSFHQAPATASRPSPLAAPRAPRSPRRPPSRGVPRALPSPQSRRPARRAAALGERDPAVPRRAVEALGSRPLHAGARTPRPPSPSPSSRRPPGPRPFPGLMAVPALTPLAARVAPRSSAPRRHVRAGAARTASVEGEGGRGRPRGRCSRGGRGGGRGSGRSLAGPGRARGAEVPAARSSPRWRGPLGRSPSGWGKGRPPPRARQRRSARRLHSPQPSRAWREGARAVRGGRRAPAPAAAFPACRGWSCRSASGPGNGRDLGQYRAPNGSGSRCSSAWRVE